jgi:hypothetical protein
MSTNSTTIKTVVIKPGETFVLPPGAVVTTLIGTVTGSSCVLPEPTNYIDHVFYYDVPSTVSGTSTPYWTGLKYGEDIYKFTTPASDGSPSTTNVQLINNLTLFSNNIAIIKDVVNGPFGPDTNSGNIRYSISLKIVETYLDKFFFIKEDAVQGNIGQGNNATQVVSYVSIKNQP